MMTKGQADILDQQIVEIDNLKARTLAHINRVPQAAIAGQQAAAQLDTEKAKLELEQANLFARHITSGTQVQGADRSVTSVVGEKPGTGQSNARPTEFEGKRAEASSGLGAEIQTLKANSGRIANTMVKVQDNLTKFEGDQAGAEKSGIAARAVTFGRDFLGFPRSAYSEMNEGQQVVAQAVDASNEFVARAMSGAAIGGGFNGGEEARMRRAFSFTPDMSPALVNATISRLERLQEIYAKQAGRIASGDVTAANALKAEMLQIASSPAAVQPKPTPAAAPQATAKPAASATTKAATPSSMHSESGDASSGRRRSTGHRQARSRIFGRKTGCGQGPR
jgi:hypothetical protein